MAKKIQAILNQYKNIAAIVLLIAVCSLVAFVIHAASSNSSTEAESGTLATCAGDLSDTSASNSSAVKFTNCTNGFTHPGILLSKSQLDFVKGKIADGAQPWADAFTNLKQHGTAAGGLLSSLSYTPAPVPEVKCVNGAGDHSLDVGCDALKADSQAAYADALRYYYSGDTDYADKAISIMNGWSAAFTPGSGDQYCNDVTGINSQEDPDPDGALGYSVPTGTPSCIGILFNPDFSNGMLEAGWSAETITRAAEIIRYEYDGWQASDIERFSTMLDEVYLPLVNHGWYGGANWLMSFADATIDIGVFNNDWDTFNLGVTDWQRSLKSVIYMSGDNNTCPGMSGYPIAPFWPTSCSTFNTPAEMDSYWHNPGQYENGLEGETCRDMTHTTMGLDAMVDAAETARLQGVDLYAGNANRMATSLEFNTRYFKQQLDTGSVPSWLCGGTITDQNNTKMAGLEIAYNALHNRLGYDMPYTEAYLDDITRPYTYKASLFMDWEELTNYGTN